ncbi:3' exoribonuclease family protein [Apiospora phragmitis]|uniref:Ribosomal RNA-processing protein 43 n=1 Tax=Apiospora phragmitis TaxID=2905665 RepID=A0ABR1VRE0_9PEZI
MATSKSMTLSSTTFAKLSPHPYLLANLQPADPSTTPTRTNGRQPSQTRTPYINTSSLSHAHGSAVVRNGDTTVICGVRGETILTSAIPNYRAPSPSDDSSSSLDEARDYDLLVPNIELATGCAPNFLPGVPPTTLAQTLSTRVYSLLHSSKLVDVSRLRIYPEEAGKENKEEDDEKMDEAEEIDEYAVAEDKAVKAYWVLYIDVLFISFDGNPFDTAWTAILAALRDTKLPFAYWDADREMVLCKPVFTAKEKQKKGSGSYWILVDPDRLEEGLCDETVTVVVDKLGRSTKILGISKHGGTVVGPELTKKMVATAESRWEQIHAAIE